MPIGNKKTWDNGIGAGPTTVIFGQQQQQSPWQQQSSQQNNNWAQGPQQPQQNNNWAQQPQQTRQATGINRGALSPGVPQPQQTAQPTAPAQNQNLAAPQSPEDQAHFANYDENIAKGLISVKTGSGWGWMTPEELRAIKRKAGYGWQFRPPDGPTGAGGHR